ncbi:MAG: S8 family serine peptidase [Actinomycetes bacterium]
MTVVLRRLLALAVLVVAAGGALPAAAASAPASGGVEVAALVKTESGRLELRRSHARTADEARGLARRWRGEPGTVAADVSVPVRALTVPSIDPLEPDQWGLPAVRARQAWEIGNASSQVIAVVDSGVDLEHADLASVLVPGRDLVDGDTVPQDVNGHGTHVAGVAAGIAGNGTGGAGAGYGARIQPVRVLDKDGGGSSSDVAEGVVWAVDHGATVVNLSLGTPYYDSVLETAVQYALGRGVPVVAAMGNEAQSGNPVLYPAAFSGVIAVGAVDSALALAPFSSTGAHIGLVAPGVNVLSTVPGGHGEMSGTSMATPFVAAATALVRAVDGTQAPATVRQRLMSTARDLGVAGFDASYGAGLVDLGAAVATAASPIARKHQELGGDSGLLGRATGSETAVTGGRRQGFERGTIWWSSGSGAHEVHGSILSTYSRLGGEVSVLGYPVTDERSTPDGRGRYNHFQRGSVYWTSSTGAREVRGGIRSTWARLGWERSALGYPTTDELPTHEGRGRYNHFERGTICWSPTTGAREVRGAIRSTWARLGWTASAVGYPITDERGTPDGRGRYNHFERGSVYWTPTTGAHEVRGAIRQHWASSGWEAGPLGYPTTDEYAVYGGRATDFEHGRIRWDAATGAVTVTRW